MSRNRMKNSQSLHWMGVVKWVLIVGLLSLLGLSYMLCKNRNLHMAQEVTELQKKLATIKTRNATLEVDLEKMKGLDELQQRLAAMRSTLVKLGDPRVTWERRDQSTRMRLAHIVHLNSMNSPMAVDTPPATPSH